MLFGGVNPVVVQMFCTALFSFVFLAHFTHVQSTTASTTIITSVLVNDTTANSTSVSPTTSSIFILNTASVSSLTVLPTSSTAPPTGPTAPTTPKNMSKGTGRKFDGLSFFGGIILGAVICIILLFSVKYYQAKKRSYHSL